MYKDSYENNWNLFDSLELIWIKFRIKLAKKKGETHIFSWYATRWNVVKRIESLGYRIHSQSGMSEYTWIFW